MLLVRLPFESRPSLNMCPINIMERMASNIFAGTFRKLTKDRLSSVHHVQSGDSVQTPRLYPVSPLLSSSLCLIYNEMGQCKIFLFSAASVSWCARIFVTLIISAARMLLKLMELRGNG